jgi:hypothetical protein
MVLHPASSLGHGSGGRGALLIALAAAWGVGLLGLGAGCQPPPVPPPKAATVTPNLPYDSSLPQYLRSSIMDYTALSNTGPFVVSSYGLVVNLRGTGNTDCPTAVREWMIKEMFRHGWGSMRVPGYEDLSPEQVLQDPRVAIVEVGAFIPPGARVGQKCDVVVQALAGNRTTSLARGLLYRCSLRVDGADSVQPGGAVNEFAKAQGYLFVNPAYAVNTPSLESRATASLRTATIPGGGIVSSDRELRLRLREPSWMMAHAIEKRIAEQFQDSTVAHAQDQTYVFLYPPPQYNGDWEHFAGVVTHMFVNSAPEFLFGKAKQLEQEAYKPKAKLMDISYCFEAMPPQIALPTLTKMMASRLPEVSYAAARAATFLNDRFGEDCLLQIARSPDHPYRLSAIQDFSERPASPTINAALADLLSDPEPLVRIAAYTVLVKNNEAHVYSQVISSDRAPESQFWLDIVDSSGPPLIYATRVGEPRVAVFGRKVKMNTPVSFAAFDTKLTISTNLQKPRLVTIYYRADYQPKPIQVISDPDLPQLIARLGGVNEDGLHFTYGEVVAVLQSLVNSDKVADSNRSHAQFVLQDLPEVQKRISAAPAIPEGSRPQGEEHTPGGLEDSLPILPKAPPTTKSSGSVKSNSSHP